MHHPTDRITHTTVFVTPVVEHWLEREIAQWVHPMKDRSDDPSHHERTLLPRNYISLLDTIKAQSEPRTPTHLVLCTIWPNVQTLIDKLTWHVLVSSCDVSRRLTSDPWDASAVVSSAKPPAVINSPVCKVSFAFIRIWSLKNSLNASDRSPNVLARAGFPVAWTKAWSSIMVQVLSSVDGSVSLHTPSSRNFPSS